METFDAHVLFRLFFELQKYDTHGVIANSTVDVVHCIAPFF